MARPQKTGLDYFPFNVDLFDDEKVIPISSEFGAKGECVVVRVLCAIYRNGYFAECSEAFKFKIAKQAGVPQSLVSEVISGLVKWGFFDRTVFDSFGIITSKGIQKRWKEATRKRVEKNELEFWLIDDKKEVSGGRNSRNSEFPAEETPLNRPESTQKKRKESKVNISSNEDISKSELQATRTHDRIDYQKLVDFFNEKTNGVFGIIRYPLSQKRQESIRARIREHGKEAFCEMVMRASVSDFLKGDNARNFKASLDWLIKPSNFQKTLEGNYDNRSKEIKRDNPDADRLEWLARKAEEAFSG